MASSSANLSQKLYDAASENDVNALNELLSIDPSLLDRSFSSCNTSSSILHIACKHGSLEFVVELLTKKPSLSEELDSNKSSPLHIASQNGHFQLIQPLVSVKPTMCFSRDMQGMNPVHLAAINGYLPVLEILLNLVPVAAKERVGLVAGSIGGDTILHLCVKYNQLDAMKMVVDKVGEADILNAKNGDGNSILHLAIANIRPEILEELLKEKRLKKYALNSNGYTAGDLLKLSTKYGVKDVKVVSLLLVLCCSEEGIVGDKYSSWMQGHHSALLVAASLVAAAAFQAGINPPAGVPDDFFFVNTVCLVFAISSVAMLIYPSPPTRPLLFHVNVSMSAAMFFMLIAYSFPIYSTVFGQQKLLGQRRLLAGMLSFVFPLLGTAFVVGYTTVVARKEEKEEKRISG